MLRKFYDWSVLSKWPNNIARYRAIHLSNTMSCSSMFQDNLIMVGSKSKKSRIFIYFPYIDFRRRFIIHRSSTITHPWNEKCFKGKGKTLISKARSHVDNILATRPFSPCGNLPLILIFLRRRLRFFKHSHVNIYSLQLPKTF